MSSGTVASSPGSLAHSRGGRGARRESLVHIVCACANYLSYHACRCYPRKYTGVSIMGVYKILKYPKMYWRTCECIIASSAHYCKRLFNTRSIISESSGNIIDTMLQSVLSLWFVT